MTRVHYIGFGGDTLSQQPEVHAGDVILCPFCEDRHELRPCNDGDEMLLFFDCGDNLKIAAIANKLVAGLKPDVSGSIDDSMFDEGEIGGVEP